MKCQIIHDSDEQPGRGGQSYRRTRVLAANHLRLRLTVKVDTYIPQQGEARIEHWHEGRWQEIAHRHGGELCVMRQPGRADHGYRARTYEEIEGPLLEEASAVLQVRLEPPG